jgi:hypothetical protein
MKVLKTWTTLGNKGLSYLIKINELIKIIILDSYRQDFSSCEIHFDHIIIKMLLSTFIKVITNEIQLGSTKLGYILTTSAGDLGLLIPDPDFNQSRISDPTTGK